MAGYVTQNPLASGEITGSGTANQVAVWATPATLGTAPISLTATPTGWVIGSLIETPSAIVSMSSTTQGFLMPSMTTAQRNAITTPATGLSVFNNTNATLSLYTGSAWVNVITTTQMPASYAIGDILYASSTTALSRLAESATVGAVLSSGGSGAAPVWNSTVGVANGGTGASLAATGGANQVLQQTSVGGAVTVGQLALASLSNYTEWTDYSASSTVTGWSSTTLKVIQYIKFNKMLIVRFNIVGTSNSVNTSFTIPFTTINTASDYQCSLGEGSDNSVASSILAEVAANTGTITCYYIKASLVTGVDTFNTWTNSGTKYVIGTIVLQVQ